jgi:hypothetical protein
MFSLYTVRTLLAVLHFDRETVHNGVLQVESVSVSLLSTTVFKELVQIREVAMVMGSQT